MVLVLLTGSFAVACAKGPLRPEPLPLDRYNCARCGMLISDLSDAAQWVARGEDARFYDDLGCAASDARRPAGGRLFVRADGGRRWISADQAFYARPAGARTPMGYGFAAFGSGAEARSSDTGGHVLRWSEVEQAVRK